MPGGVKSYAWWGKAEKKSFFLKLWIFGSKYQKMILIRPAGTSPGDFCEVDDFHNLSGEKEIWKIGQDFTEL